MAYKDLSRKSKDYHLQWERENTKQIKMRLNIRTDADILEFLDKHAKQTVIKEALREYMKNHAEDADD